MAALATNSVAQKATTKAGDIITGIIVFVVVIFVIVAVWKVYKGARAAAGAVGDTLGDAIIANANSMPVQRVQLCREVANDLVNNIGPWYTFYNIDEEAWISALNRLETAVEAKLVSRFFKEQESDGLRSKVNGAFSTSEKARVKQVVMSNIY